MDSRLTLQQIVSFLRLAEAGSFRDAAVALGVSQPALSRTIQQIEARLDVRLFDRDTRKVRLTPAGEYLYPLVRRIHSEYEDAFTEYDRFAAGARGVVRIAALPSLAAMLLPGAIASFRQLHPDVRIEIWEDVGLPVHKRVLDHVADIGLAPPPPVSEGLNYRPLLRDQVVLVCKTNDPLAGAGVQDWEIFAKRPFVTTSHETGLRAMIDHAFQAAGVQAEPLLSCKQPATVGSLVNAGVGLGVLSRLTLTQLDSPTLVGIPLQGPVVSRSLGAVTQIGRSLSPAARLLLVEIERRAANLSQLLGVSL